MILHWSDFQWKWRCVESELELEEDREIEIAESNKRSQDATNVFEKNCKKINLTSNLFSDKTICTLVWCKIYGTKYKLLGISPLG